MAPADKNISTMSEDRWLVSYADFITLLFAFFVVMFASSQVDRRKMAMMSAAFDSYVNRGEQSAHGPTTRKGARDSAAPPAGPSLALGLTMAELEPAREKLNAELANEIMAGEVEISLQPRGLVLSLKESAFFAPGDDVVSPLARPIFAKVAAALRGIPGQIRLEGHTDDTPIHTRRFPSNWHLSSARSIAVLKLLTQDFRLPAERFAVAGYGQYRPLESNRSAEGRHKNRRVDVVILTRDAASLAPS
jgi:chemotaxis protein MotB